MSSGTPNRNLLERDREREALRAVVEAARAGTGAAAVIDGPAGIGKTTLLHEAASLAQQAGLAPLRARGGEMERGVRQLLEREARDLAADAQAVQGAARLALPVLGLGDLQDVPREEAEREFALCHGLYWLCSDMAERRPLALFVDDLHELDPPSLRFLLYLVRRVQGMPVAIVAATRAGASASDPETLAQLAPTRRCGPSARAALVRPASPRSYAHGSTRSRRPSSSTPAPRSRAATRSSWSSW